MDGNIISSLLLKLVKDVVDLLHRLIMTSVRAAHNDKHADRILVDILLHELWVKTVVGFGADGKDTSLDFKVACKLFQCNLMGKVRSFV